MSTTPAEIAEPLPVVAKRRRRWLSVLVGVLIFGGGFATGVGVTIVTAVHRLHYAIHHPEQAPARVAATLKRKLSLDEAQTSKVESVVAKHLQVLIAIHNEFLPKVMEQLRQIRDEIGETLDEKQREHWYKMFDDVRERWLPALPPAEKHEK
jgi:predicted Co/Zn/Cd cation transporter (cation efflux family)